MTFRSLPCDKFISTAIKIRFSIQSPAMKTTGTRGKTTAHPSNFFSNEASVFSDLPGLRSHSQMVIILQPSFLRDLNSFCVIDFISGYFIQPPIGSCFRNHIIFTTGMAMPETTMY